MLKWILTVVIALVVIGAFLPHLKRKVPFGQLPGDLHLRWRGRDYYFPLTSTLILSALLALLSRVL